LLNAYFGKDEVVEKRVNTTLAENAPFGTVHRDVSGLSNADIWKKVDLTFLFDRTDEKASQTAEEKVRETAIRAVEVGAATVCVFPEYVHIVLEVMKERGSTIQPIAVVGFPFVEEPSEEATRETVRQTIYAMEEGATEIDMVLPRSFGKIRSGDHESVYLTSFEYVKAVVDAAKAYKREDGIPIKVKLILETAYLTPELIAEGCVLGVNAGVDFLKTSTGFAKEQFLADGKNINEHKGARAPDVALIRITVGDDIEVKASGGVKTREDALAVLEAGATRIGASGIDLGEEKKATVQGY
jgi:deoxyribose-phosphate aldolase